MTGQIFAGLAIAIHIYTFIMESLLWGKPNTNRVFGMSPEMAEHNRLFAFNQGFYNLFLAGGGIAGLVMNVDYSVGRALVTWSMLSMMFAGFVLLYSKPTLVRAAMIQSVPPFLALTFLYFG